MKIEVTKEQATIIRMLITREQGKNARERGEQRAEYHAAKNADAIKTLDNIAQIEWKQLEDLKRLFF